MPAQTNITQDSGEFTEYIGQANPGASPIASYEFDSGKGTKVYQVAWERRMYMVRDLLGISWAPDSYPAADLGTLQPYDIRTIKVILIAILAYLSGRLIPTLDNFIVDGIARSSVVLLVFSILIFKSNASEDINVKVREIFINIVK